MLPLLGAGFSLNAELPKGLRMPTWQALGKELAPEVRYLPPDGDALEVISAYKEEHGRQALIARLRKALHVGVAKPGAAHMKLARLPFDVVATTNFDPLLEEAYGIAQRPIHLVVREDQLALRYPRAAITLVKAHGDLDNEPALVATEEDYDEFLLRRPLLATYLANHLITRVGLLIGYSLSDHNWRALLAGVRSRLGRGSQMIYVLTVDADPLETERFRRRGVKLIDVRAEGRSYQQALCDTFDEMRDHIAEHTLDNSTFRDEGALEELRTTEPGERRLCLFMVPEERLAFYRQQVFPLLRQAAVTPITPHDVDAPGATLYARVIALLEQVRAAVVDLSVSGSGAAFEAGLLLSATWDGDIAFVASEMTMTADANDRRIFFINDPLDAPEFPRRVHDWAVEALGVTEQRAHPAAAFNSDPNWEVLRVFRDLELALRARYPHGAFSLIDLIEQAVGDGLLTPPEAAMLRDAFRLRNRVLHEHYSATREEADVTTARVAQVLEDLD